MKNHLLDEWSYGIPTHASIIDN